MAITIQEVRQKYPEYQDLSDKQLADSLHQKFYSDIPINNFYNQIGLNVEQPAQPEELTASERLEDAALSVGSGTYKGLSYIPGAAGDIEQLGRQFLPEFMTRPISSFFDDSAPKETKLFPTSKEIRETTEGFIPQLKTLEEYDPKTTTGQYLQTIPEFAAPGLLGKTSAARKLATKIGAGTGAVYETVENISNSPLVATGVSLPFALLASFLAGPTKAALLSEQAFKTASKQDIKDAIQLETIAKTEGVKLLPGETIDNKFVNQLTQDVLKSERGAPYIYESVKGRPIDAQNLANKQASKIADMPESQRKVLQSIQETAKSAIKDSKRQRSAAAYNAGYKVSNDETITISQALNIIRNIDDAISQSAPKSANQKKLKQIRSQLIEKEGIKDKEKFVIPVTNINKLDEVFKTYRDAVKDSRKNIATDRRFVQKDLAQKLFNKEKTGVLDSLVDALNTNPNYKKANEVYSELSETLVNVVKDNTGVLAREGLDLTNIEKFVFNPETAKPKDINNTLKILNAANPEATKQIANIYFRNAINNAFPIAKQGEDLTQGFKLIKIIAGTGNQRKNFMAVLDNVADAHGVNKKDFKVGFENMINILERTGRINNINKPGFDVQGIAARTLLKDAAVMKTFNPLVRLSTKYGELQAGGTMNVLGRIMGNDNAVASLIELGRTNPQSKAAILRVLNIINAVSPLTERLDSQPAEE